MTKLKKITTTKPDRSVSNDHSMHMPLVIAIPGMPKGEATAFLARGQRV